MKEGKFHRRQFIQGIAAAGAVSVLGACTKSVGTWRFFTDAEGKLLDLITEQIVPGDDEFPGASYAGVVNYVDKQLVGPYTRFQEDYRTGLLGVEETSNAMFSKSFGQLTWDNQTKVLQALEEGHPQGATWQALSSRSFFSMVVDHTMQGYYGSPRHGGNRNYVSYHMIGLDYPQIIGQNRYKQA